MQTSGETSQAKVDRRACPSPKLSLISTPDGQMTRPDAARYYGVSYALIKAFILIDGSISPAAARRACRHLANAYGIGDAISRLTATCAFAK